MYVAFKLSNDQMTASHTEHSKHICIQEVIHYGCEP